jgi:hypothetical protein
VRLRGEDRLDAAAERPAGLAVPVVDPCLADDSGTVTGVVGFLSLSGDRSRYIPTVSPEELVSRMP